MHVRRRSGLQGHIIDLFLRFFSPRTLGLVRFDLLRLRGRLFNRGRSDVTPDRTLLHFGCGSRKITDWLNVDLTRSDYDLDLTAGRLPWRDDSFRAALGQHVIEHLELRNELLPLLRELRRVLSSGGELWLSCPDIEKICRSYLDNRMVDLIEDRERRAMIYCDRVWTLDNEVGLEGVPSSHMINSLFYQGYEHQNLFDYALLEWVLRLAGFQSIERKSESELLARFPEIPGRDDDAQALYVRALTDVSKQ